MLSRDKNLKKNVDAKDLGRKNLCFNFTNIIVYICENNIFYFPVGFYFARQRNWDHLDKKKDDNNNNDNSNGKINGTTPDGRAKQLLNRTGQKLKSLTVSA